MPKEVINIRHFTSGLVSGLDPKDIKDDSFIWSENIDSESALGRLHSVNKLKKIKSGTLFTGISETLVTSTENPSTAVLSSYSNRMTPGTLLVIGSVSVIESEPTYTWLEIVIVITAEETSSRTMILNIERNLKS